MRETNALVTHTDANIIGLYPLSIQPSNSDQIATKGWLNSNYYMDNTIAPYNSYTNDRCPRYQDILGAAIGALPNFYQYDVYRYGIPGAEGAYFTYTDEYGNTNEIIQDEYGYVGRYCMEENSYMNNQWNVYSITQVGVCYPNNQGTSYPYPPSPQYRDNNFIFTLSPGYVVKDMAIFDSAGNPKYIHSGIYNNDYYLNPTVITTGIHYIRYFIYTTGGQFVTKVGFRGYPAREVTFLDRQIYSFIMFATEDYSLRCSDSVEQNFYWSYDETLIVGSRIFIDQYETIPYIPYYLYIRDAGVSYRVNSYGVIDAIELCNRDGGGEGILM